MSIYTLSVNKESRTMIQDPWKKSGSSWKLNVFVPGTEAVFENTYHQDRFRNFRDTQTNRQTATKNNLLGGCNNSCRNFLSKPPDDRTPARLITGVWYNDHITPTLHDTLHWLPVSQRITTLALMTYDCIRDRSPALLFYVTSLYRSSSDFWRWHDRATHSNCALWSMQFPHHDTPD